MLLTIFGLIVFFAIFSDDEPKPTPEQLKRLNASLARTTAYWNNIFKH